MMVHDPSVGSPSSRRCCMVFLFVTILLAFLIHTTNALNLGPYSYGCTATAAGACPTKCSSCLVTISTCTYQTPCPTDYGGCNRTTDTLNRFDDLIDGGGRCYSYNCIRAVNQTTTNCAACAGNFRYGTNCTNCPGLISGNIPCNGNGDCDYGYGGSGSCACDSGFAGPACQYSVALTCNNRASAVSDAGVCTCLPQYSGSSCQFCNNVTNQFYGVYPSCVFCDASSTCSGHGTCDTTQTATGGNCKCSTAYTGSTCSGCASSYYNYPTCLFCNSATTCGSGTGRGTCDSTYGTCICNTKYTQSASGANDCNGCQLNYYGSTCQACIGGVTPSTVCNGRGSCDWGASASGACICTTPYRGTDCSDPAITDISPLNGPNSGLTYVTINGRLFGSTGASGFVVIGNSTANKQPIFSWSQNQIVFQTNPLIGVGLPIQVYTEGGARSSNKDFTFAYDPPTLNWIECAPDYVQNGCGANTDGSDGAGSGVIITVRGSSFYTGGGVMYFNGTAMTITGNYDADRLRFYAPFGQGNAVVQLLLGSVWSNQLIFSYNAPVVTSVIPASGGVTTGGFTITVNGYNFGQRLASLTQWRPVVTIDGSVCIYGTHTDSYIQCTAPQYGGGAAAVVVTLSSIVQVTPYPYTQLPPTVTALRATSPSCSAASYPRTTGCPVVGWTSGTPVILTVYGTNFGPAGTPATNYKISVQGALCTSPGLYTAHTEVRCNLPAGYGVYQTVEVCVGTAGANWVCGSAPLLSYASPGIDPGTLQLASGGTAGTSLVISDTLGGQKVQFGGSYFGVQPTQVVVTYGTQSNPTIYPCAVGSTDLTNTLCKCTLSPGVGGPLYFRIVVSGVASNVASDQLFYPLPVINNNTIALRSNLNTTGSAVTGLTTQGEDIVFQGNFFGTQPANGLGNNFGTYITVSYGLGGVYGCSVQSSTTTNTQISCHTSPGEGQYYKMTVCTGPASDAMRCSTGFDQYSYPTAPLVNTIRGCQPFTGPDFDGTVNCPTTASYASDASTNIRLTISGQFFGSSASVSVGGTSCLGVGHAQPPNGDLSLTCILPIGVGLLRPVVVRAGTYSSRESNLVSYAYPTLIGVTGCNSQNGNNTVDCNRLGGETITLTGINFGSDVPQVVVGGSPCTNVVQASGLVMKNQQVTCTTPSGVGQGLSVLLIQAGGKISQQFVTVSYLQCTPGFYSTTDPICRGCAIGRYTDLSSSPSCLACPLGKYAPLNSTSACTSCSVGTFANVSALAACYPCAAGSFASAEGLPSCSLCPVGQYSFGGASSCSLCGQGYFAGSTGMSACLGCTVGTAVAVSGQSVCTQCDPGYSSSSVNQVTCSACGQGSSSNLVGYGSSSCPQCPAGSYADTAGLRQCKPCPLGFYSNTVGSVQCSSCAAGKNAPGTGYSICVDCGAGRYSGAGAAECTLCAQGTATATNGTAGSCTPCQRGTYQDVLGQATCVPCAAGASGSETGLLQCTQCGGGTYANQTGFAECSSCQPGYRSLLLLGSTGCVACDQGYVSQSSKSSVCTSCLEGSYAPYRGMSDCFNCVPGSYTSSRGLVGCTQCSAGSSAEKANAVTCDQCAAGKYSPIAGTAACTSCLPGYYQDASGQDHCAPCLPGFEATLYGSVSCTACIAGKFAAGYGNPQCTICPEGKYSEQNFTAGATYCTNCAPGSFAKGGAADKCSLCPKGTATTQYGMPQCPDCQPGKFAGQFGQLTCDACPIETATTATKSSACDPCSPGLFSNVTGLSQCYSCVPGRFQDQLGTSVCKDCGFGTYSSSERGQKCTPCLGGFYSAAYGLVSCNACPIGQAQHIQNQTACINCVAGRFNDITGQEECRDCLRGKATTQAHRTVCDNCVAGYYQEEEGQLHCDPCPVGRAANAEQASSCDFCTAGRYAPINGSVQCSDCPGGRYTELDGATFCKITPMGYFSAPGSKTFSQCTSRTVAPFTEMGACLACDQNSDNNDDYTACVCFAGSYSLGATVNNTELNCYPCPLGAECSKAGVTWETLGAVVGWWRRDNDSLAFYRCLLPVHCGGGRGDICRVFRTGPLCALCLPGYRSSSGTSECTLCPSAGASIGVSFVIIFFVVVALLILYYVVLHTDRRLLLEVKFADEQKRRLSAAGPESKENSDESAIEGETEEQARTRRRREERARAGARGAIDESKLAKSGDDASRLRSKRVAASVAVPDELLQAELIEEDSENKLRMGKEWEAYGLHLDEDAAKDDQKVQNTPVLTAESRSRPNFTHKLKILIGFLQIATNLAFFVDIPWPKHYISFIETFNIVNLDFVPWQSVGCVSKFDFYSKFLVVTLVPIGVLVALFFLFLLPMQYIDQRDMSDAASGRDARKRSRRMFWKLVLFTIFLIYPNVSSVVLNMFVCKSVDGTSYLQSDFTILCTDERWFKFLGPDIIMVLLYPLGVPLFFFWQLYRHRTRLLAPGIRMQFGFLYEAYNLDVWWFELMDMAHKLTMTSLLKFFPQSIQMPGGMVVSIGYLVVILIRQPYLRKGDDRLHLFVQIELFLVVLCGFILWHLDVAYLDESTDVLLSIVMILMTIGMVIVFVVMAVRNLHKIYLNWKRKRQRAADIAAGRSSTLDERSTTEKQVAEMTSMKKQWVSPM